MDAGITGRRGFKSRPWNYKGPCLQGFLFAQSRNMPPIATSAAALACFLRRRERMSHHESAASFTPACALGQGLRQRGCVPST